MHLYSATEWEQNGVWHVNDVEDLAGMSGLWWIPCHILDIAPIDFVQMLIEDFNAEVRYIHNEDYFKDILIYSFKNNADARKYRLFINQKAREKQFYI